jgi:hypothetical protein
MLLALASREPLVAGLAAIIDIGRLHLGAFGELDQQVEDLRVAVLCDQTRGAVSPAAPARLANDCQRRLANVRQGEGVFRLPKTIAGR